MSDSSNLSISGMSAETGFEETESQQGLRISGFVSILLGLLGSVALITPTMVMAPIAGLALAVFSRRKFVGPPPAGYTAGLFGGMIATFFLFAGFFVHHLEQRSMGNQAEFFARQYLKIVAMDEAELALELKKNPIDRFLAGMSLSEYYSQVQAELDRQRSEQERPDTVEGSGNILNDFRNDGANRRIRAMGVDCEWELQQRPRFYARYGQYKSDLFFETATDDPEFPLVIWIQLEMFRNKKTNDFEWKVQECQIKTERLVADSIL